MRTTKPKIRESDLDQPAGMKSPCQVQCPGRLHCTAKRPSITGSLPCSNPHNAGLHRRFNDLALPAFPSRNRQSEINNSYCNLTSVIDLFRPPSEQQRPIRPAETE